MRLSGVRNRAASYGTLPKATILPSFASSPDAAKRPSTASSRKSSTRRSGGGMRSFARRLYPEDDPDIKVNIPKPWKTGAMAKEQATQQLFVSRSSPAPPELGDDSSSLSSSVDDTVDYAVYQRHAPPPLDAPLSPTAAALSATLQHVSDSRHPMSSPIATSAKRHVRKSQSSLGTTGLQSTAGLMQTPATESLTEAAEARVATILGSPIRRVADTFSPPLRRPDISFMKDSIGHGIMPSPTTLLSYKQVPRSRIPMEYHVSLTAEHIPDLEQDFEWRRTADRQWVRQVFPSPKPCGRQDALHLDRALEVMLDDINRRKHAGAYFSCAPMYEELHMVTSSCFLEVLRQVAYHCAERGSVLARIWKRYETLFSDFHAAAVQEMQDYRAECDARLASALAELARERELLGKELQARIAALEAENERLRQELAARNLELANLKEDMEYKMNMMRTQINGLKRQLEKEKAARLAERQQYEASLAALKDEMRQMRDKFAAERSRLEAMLNKALNDLTRAQRQRERVPSVHDTTVEVAHIATQTDAVEAVEPKARRRRGGKIKSGGGSSALPRAFLKRCVRYIQQIYKDKLLADRVDDQKDNSRQTLPEYVEDWFDNRFGRDPKSRSLKPKFLQAMQEFRTDSPYVSWFGRMWGQYPDAPLDDPVKTCDDYLHILGVLLANVKGRQRTFTTDGFGVMVHLRSAQSLIPVIFGRKFAASPHNNRLIEQMKTMQFIKSKVEWIDQEDLMQLLLSEYGAHVMRQRKTLGDLFEACDTDGDGNLDLDEFTSLLEHVGERLPSTADIKKLYNAALLPDGSMTKDTFVTAYLKMGLLELARGSSIARVPGLDESLPPGEQWAILKEVWRMRQEFVVSVVEALDGDRKESLAQRVTKLETMLAEDEPGESLDAAIMCFSMVLSEAETANDSDTDETDSD